MNAPAKIRAMDIAELASRPKIRDAVRYFAQSSRLEEQPIEKLERAFAECEAALAPAGPEATAILLDRLFSVLPMPNGDGLNVWIELLSEYPAFALKEAIDDCIRQHKWNSPPSIADIDARVKENDHLQDLRRPAFELFKAIYRAKARARSTKPIAQPVNAT